MCGRIAQPFSTGDLDPITRKVGTEPNKPAQWNVSPSTYIVALARSDHGGCMVINPYWGFIAPWSKVPDPDLVEITSINAKAETMGESKLFGKALQTTRCLVPVTAWYEWRRMTPEVKQPYAIGRADQGIVTLGAIYCVHRDRSGVRMRSLAIITTPAPLSLAGIHERAPLVIGEAHRALWLGIDVCDPSPLLHAGHSHDLTAWPVPRAINARHNDGPELLEPVAADSVAAIGKGYNAPSAIRH
jgi:putative SOS response-associated peptidase YedK